MDFDEVLSSMTPDIYLRLKQAVELGKWPNGNKLSPQQTEVLLQATLTYAARENLTPDELFTINPQGDLLEASSQKASYKNNKSNFQQNTIISVRTKQD